MRSACTRFIPLLLLALCCGTGRSLAITIATGLPSSASSGAGSSGMGITFCIQNTTSAPVTLTGIDNYMASGNGNSTWQLRYSASSLSGAANLTTWTLVATTTGPSVSTTGIYPLFSGLSLSIPANTTYRFALITSASSINYGGATTTPNIHSASGVNLLRGSYLISSLNVGYAGTATAPGFVPRFFAGTVYLNAGPPCTGTPTAPVISTAALTAPVCANGTKSITATNAGAPTSIAYQWEQSANPGGPWSSVSGGTGANTLSYTTAALTTTTYYRVKAICGNNSAVSAAYEVLVGPQPSGPITGTTQVCPNTTYTYTVTPALGATSYTWTKPSGWSGSSTGNAITVTTTSTVGSITVKPAGACGNSPTMSLTVTGNTPPGQPAQITGPNVFCNGSLQQYTIPALSNTTSYLWTLPAGWTFSGSSTANTVNVVSNSTAGLVKVRGVNGCGNGPESALPVTYSTSSPVTPTASISTASPSVCSGAPVVFNAAITQGGSFPAYQWKRNGTPVSSNPSYAAINLSTGDVISLTLVSNATCASPATVNSSNTITMNVTPSVVAGVNVNLNAPNDDICAGSPVQFNANATGTGASPVYQWYRNTQPTGSNTPNLTVSSLLTGDSIYVVMTSSAACVAGSPVRTSNKVGVQVLQTVVPAVAITAAPGGVVQANTPVTFTASEVNGGATPQYQWLKNGQVIFGANGAVYTTAGLQNGDQIAVRMVSTADCALPNYVVSNAIGVQVATGIFHPGGNPAGIALAPNPNRGTFEVFGPWDRLPGGTSGLVLEVVNALGQTVLRVVPEAPAPAERLSLQLPQDVPAGIYLLRVANAGGAVAALRFELRGRE